MVLNRTNPATSLVYYPDPILRRVCPPVEKFDSTLQDLVRDMMERLRLHFGIGLAAPQVGLLQRLLVCRIENRSVCLANPEILETAQPGELNEGCLSLPGRQVRVRRPERIRVSGYDEAGQKRSFGATGLWARVIQHEMDHLNGVLICDYRDTVPKDCSHCPLTLPTALVEERKRRLHRHK
jgi:peptide deformylase